MKLTIKEWSVVMKALEEQLAMLDKKLEEARNERELVMKGFFTEHPEASDSDLYKSLAYERASNKVNTRFDKWIELKGVADKMKLQEV